VPAVYTMRTFPAILPDDVRSAYFSMTAYLAGRQAPGSGLDLLKISSAEAPGKAGKDLRLASPVNDWEAVDNRYFTCIAAPTGPVTALYMTPVMPSTQYLAGKPERFVQPNLALYTKGELGAMKPGDTASLSFKVYAGPREDDLLSKASVDEQGRSHDFNAVVVYGYGWFAKFDWLSRMLLAVLNFFAAVIPNYGIAIFLLTAAVKLVMFPMQRKGYISMQKMAALAPQVAQLKKKYEHDKSSDGMRRMQMEMMDLYRKNGVSPLGGCLPMLVQLPMFVALYGTLRSAFELRQQGFLWIDDLTQPDSLFNLHFVVPYFEWTVFNLLPILYVGLMVWSTMMQPKPTDPQQQMQRKMMMFMPVMMFFIFYSMPSGLVLYFVFSSGIGLVEQWVIKRHMARDPLIAAMKRAQAQGGTAVALASAGNGESERETAWDKEQKREEKERQKREERRKREQNRRM